jgi:plasmid stabilization system protein ParE
MNSLQKNAGPMGWTIDLTAQAQSDLRAILRHLTDSYVAFGEPRRAARRKAEVRTYGLVASLERLATAPLRGTRLDDLLPGLRHVRLDDLVVWFTPNEDAEAIRVLALFFSGQNHLARMQQRLRFPPQG